LQLKDYNRSLQTVEDFLPYIDNWSVCDTFTPISFQENLADVEVKIREWIKSNQPYTVRFGIEMLMNRRNI